MSVTLQADKSHVPDDMGTKEKVIERPPVSTDSNFSMSSSSHLPHRQSPLLKHRCTTSIPTGKCEQSCYSGLHMYITLINGV